VIALFLFPFLTRFFNFSALICPKNLNNLNPLRILK
jgi:hypothetical protein